jgi:hypothetical protein
MRGCVGTSARIARLPVSALIYRLPSPSRLTRRVANAVTATLCALAVAMLLAVSSFAAATDGATSAQPATSAPSTDAAPPVDACAQGQNLEELGRYDEAIKAYIGGLSRSKRSRARKLLCRASKRAV